MDKAGLKRILLEPRNALTRQYRQLFAYQGVELDFTDQSLTHIAQDAVKHGTGARGLRSILENLLRSTMFMLPSTPGLCRCVVDVADDGVLPRLRVREICGDRMSPADRADRPGLAPGSGDCRAHSVKPQPESANALENIAD